MPKHKNTDSVDLWKGIYFSNVINGIENSYAMWIREEQICSSEFNSYVKNMGITFYGE